MRKFFVILFCQLASVSLYSAPQRIISGSLASDEILVEILRRDQIGGRLIAVSLLADDPVYSNIVNDAKAVPGRFGGEFESILRLRPDLVIVAGYNRPEMLRRIADAKVAAFVLGQFATLSDVAANIVKLGKLVGAEKGAAGVKAEFENSLSGNRQRWAAKIRGKPKPRVISYSPDMTVMGDNTTFDSIVEAAGGHNVARELGIKGWQKIGAEALLTHQPDYVVVAQEGPAAEVVRRQVLSSPGWRELKAVRQGRLIIIPARELMALSHHAAKAVEKLTTGLYFAHK